MADELALSISASETKNTVTFTKSFNDTFDVSGSPVVDAIASIGTSDETIGVGDVTSLGYIMLKNLDATNYVQIGYTSGTYFAKLKAGEFCLFRAGTGLTTIHAIANTAACNLAYLVFSD